MSERITGHTELIGLMAYPIRHSSSPAMQNEAFAKLGYDYAYLAFEVGADEIEDAVKAIRTLKMRGSNVSMPNKTLVGQYLDELSPAAEMCGAVNTIVNDHGHLTGHITDGIGFMAALKDNNIDAIGKKMTIVGAGGAATAIEIQAALDGVGEIVIFNRKDEFWDRAVSTVEKSMCERNSAPSSRNLRIPDNENTWKPPLSVSIGRSKPLNLCSPPAFSITSSPGRR